MVEIMNKKSYIEGVKIQEIENDKEAQFHKQIKLDYVKQTQFQKLKAQRTGHNEIQSTNI